MLPALRNHIVPVIFALALTVFGCSSALQSPTATGNGGITATTQPSTSQMQSQISQIAQLTGQIAGSVAATAPGTPVGNTAGIVAALSGLILIVDKVITGSRANTVTGPPANGVASQTQQPPKVG